jgi:hypothetical protein
VRMNSGLSQNSVATCSRAYCSVNGRRIARVTKIMISSPLSTPRRTPSIDQAGNAWTARPQKKIAVPISMIFGSLSALIQSRMSSPADMIMPARSPSVEPKSSSRTTNSMNGANASRNSHNPNSPRAEKSRSAQPCAAQDHCGHVAGGTCGSDLSRTLKGQHKAGQLPRRSAGR